MFFLPGISLPLKYLSVWGVSPFIFHGYLLHFIQVPKMSPLQSDFFFIQQLKATKHTLFDCFLFHFLI